MSSSKRPPSVGTQPKDKPRKTRPPARHADKETQHWQEVENVMAALERVRNGIPGIRVTQKAMLPTIHDPNDRREVDVLVEIPTGGRMISIGIEVKRKRRPLDLVSVGSVISLMEELHVDRFCLVSASGLTKRAAKLAWRKGVEVIRIEEFETSALLSFPRGTSIRRNQIELTCTDLRYPDALLAEQGDYIRSLIRNSVKNITIENMFGSATLEQALVGLAIENIPQGIGDQGTFQVGLDLVRGGVRLHLLGKDIPLPDAIVGTIRIHQQVEDLDEKRFRVGDVEMSTTVTEYLGERKQLTTVLLKHEDGRQQIGASIGPASPTKTKVEGRRGLK